MHDDLGAASNGVDFALVLRTEPGETHLAFWKADFVGIVNCWELSQKVVRYFGSCGNENQKVNLFDNRGFCTGKMFKAFRFQTQKN